MNDQRHLERAAELAAPWMTFPNPRVGCVIVDDAGNIVGEGAHHRAGEAHAEVNALAQAGTAARGATAYVTLEPCSHTGRTGPCTQALIDAGVRRVVIGVPDPHPLAAGGALVLHRAGIAVDFIDSLASAAVNEHWLHAMRHGRPFVTLKLASTLDGRVASAHGEETAISNAASKRRVHELRARVDAVLVGSGTAVVDDPRLDVRGLVPQRQPRRFVMGTRRLPSGLQVLHGDEPGVQLRTRDPHGALALLHAADVRHVLLEGGPTLATAFLEAGLVDECIWITASTVFGAGPLALAPLGRVHRWRRVATDDVEGDLWSQLRPV